MGFFDFLGSVVDFVVDKAERVVDFFGDLFGGETSYEKETADVYTTERLNEILVSFTDEYLPQTSKIEFEVIKEIEKYYNDLISEVQKSNIKSEAYMQKKLKREKNEIRATILGSIRSPLEKRMSLSDRECLEILKMDSGTAKKKKMNQFVQKIIDEAFNNLVCNVEKSLREATEEVKECFENLLKDREEENAVMKNQYENLLNEKRKEVDKEKLYAEWLLTIRSLETIEQLLLSGKERILYE